jgi:hypothetical protein
MVQDAAGARCLLAAVAGTNAPAAVLLLLMLLLMLLPPPPLQLTIHEQA